MYQPPSHQAEGHESTEPVSKVNTDFVLKEDTCQPKLPTIP